LDMGKSHSAPGRTPSVEFIVRRERAHEKEMPKKQSSGVSRRFAESKGRLYQVPSQTGR
jgi:hypothetical protein